MFSLSHHIWYLLAGSILLCTSAAAPLRAESQSAGTLASASASDLIAEVNALRASNGLPAYSVHAILMQIAQNHANYQAATGTTTHYSADGSRPFQRALAAGYPVAGDLSRGGFFSENITAGSNMSASAAVSSWSGDAPHLNTMLSPNLQDVGAGVATSSGLTYYTLDAGLASGSPVNYTPPAGGTFGTPGTPIVSQFMLPVALSTPLESGAVYHEVQFGQTLWSIAIAYEVTVEQIKSLNGLTGIDIYEGQKLLVTRQEVATPGVTETLAVSATSEVLTATHPAQPSATATLSPPPEAPTTAASGSAAVITIIATALLAAGLGTWIGLRRSPG